VAVHSTQYGKTLRGHWHAVRAQRGERVKEHVDTVPEFWNESKSLKTLGIARVSRCWGLAGSAAFVEMRTIFSRCAEEKLQSHTQVVTSTKVT
jgi:hypothetical protein